MQWEIFFKDVPDFRINRRKKHRLIDILAISVCAVVCGANDFEEIAMYGNQKKDFLHTFLELSNGIPSHDTFYRVFKFLDKKTFSECLYRWSKELLSTINEGYTQINIDGKVLRATAKSGSKKSGICLISAWVSEHELVLGQQRVDGKSNEKTAIPELLDSLDLENSIVTIDAIACECKNADLITAKKGHYVLALKNNNKHIYQQVSERMKQNYSQLANYQDIDFGSGRIETRTCYVENNLTLYDDLADWTHLKSIVLIESKREVKGIVSIETRYYLSNLTLSPKDFNTVIRNHWSIENKLHWKLDVVFLEDLQRTKSINAPENLAIVRKLALQMLNRVQDKESIKNRRKIAGWSDQYLLKVSNNI
ncbi:ISAs1 family transposase [Emticicia soli]|uniref:ISAs1 family transposase n=1 Tax=Emticicia soli TaxID=2027878 RepID=A0ABW5J0I0_9BACT